jgi:hypothetical protein
MSKHTKTKAQVTSQTLQSSEEFKSRSAYYLLPGILNRRQAVADITISSVMTFDD